MTMQFNGQRFLQLMLNDLRNQFRMLAITSVAALGVYLIIYVLMVYNQEIEPLYHVLYPITLLVGGSLFTSISFIDLHHPQQRYYYLTMPCSNLERFLSRWALTSVCFLLFSLLFYVAFELIGQTITQLLFGQVHPFFRIANEVTRNTMMSFFVVHAVVMLGAVYFRKYHLVKTVLSVFLFSGMCLLIFIISFRIVYWDLFEGFSFETKLGVDIEMDFPTDLFHGSGFEQIRNIIEILFWPAVTIFLWGISYLRITETEV